MNTLEKQIIAHAKKEYPKESCGLIVNGNYIPCENIADNPMETFRIGHNDWCDCDVVVHSHPQGQRFLSGADRSAQHKMRCDWWLVVGDADNWEIIKYPYTPLLRGRTFEYGVNDCCTMITDSYRLCGITLKDYQRGTEQEDINNNKIINSLKDTGFYEVPLDELQAGDVILTSIRGNANHASIYLGNEEVLHHPYGGLSRREGMGGVWHKSMHSAWRHTDWRPEMITAILNDLEAK